MTVRTGYESIIGYNDIKAMLKRTVKKDNPNHAYIFCGEAGSGKTVMANVFATALLCEKHMGDACMECASCKKAQSRNNPDIVLIHHEKTESIGVDVIRDQVVDDILIKPFVGKYKIYIIPEAQNMTIQAQNALLKTLEEPPAYAVIIMIAKTTEELLPTVISRCALIRFNPLSDEIVRDYLEKQMLIPKEAASLYAALAMGRIGTAKKLALSDEFSNKLNQSIIYLRESKDIDAIERIEKNKIFTSNKKEIEDYLDIFTIWFRDVLLFKATKEKENIIIKEEFLSIKKRAAVSSYEGLQIILDAIDNAKVRLRANVNAELVIELLLLTISDN